MAKDSDEKALAAQRDEVIKRMIATPPKTHAEEPKRRKTPSPEVRQLPKKRTNKNRNRPKQGG